MNVGESKVLALEAVGELFVVEAKEMEESRVEVVDVDLLLGICFWRKGRGNPGLAEYMGEKGG